MAASDRFEFQRVLGRGSFGVASLVRERHSGAFCVAKEISLGASIESIARRTAENEVEVLKALSHVNIVAYCESFVEAHTFVIIMEYADGGDLAAAIKRKQPLRQRFRQEEAISVLLQCARALQHIHLRHIVHRDVKSQNVFLTSTGEVKLGDFGVARVLEAAGDFAVTAIGTPSHLAPEVCHGEAYGTQADMWSFGVVMFEVLALEPPFQAENILALVSRITTAAPKVVSREPFDDDLWALVRRMLQKVPEDRPNAANVLASRSLRRFSMSPGAAARGMAGVAQVAAGAMEVAGEAMALAAHARAAWSDAAVANAAGAGSGEGGDALDDFMCEQSCCSDGEDSQITEALRRELGLPEIATPSWARKRGVHAPPNLHVDSRELETRDSLDELLSGLCGSGTLLEAPDSLSSRSSTVASRAGTRSRASSSGASTRAPPSLGISVDRTPFGKPKENFCFSSGAERRPSKQSSDQDSAAQLPGIAAAGEKATRNEMPLNIRGFGLAAAILKHPLPPQHTLLQPPALAPLVQPSSEDYPRLLGRRRTTVEGVEAKVAQDYPRLLGRRRTTIEGAGKAPSSKAAAAAAAVAQLRGKGIISAGNWT